MDVDEATYQDIIQKRREDNFIEDDEGTGAYVDFGQEDWDDEEYGGDDDLAKRAKQGGSKKQGLFNNLAPRAKKTATERVSNMFLGGRDVIAGAKVAKGGKDDSADALVDSLLGEIESDPLNMATSRTTSMAFRGVGTATAPLAPAGPRYTQSISSDTQKYKFRHPTV